MKKILALILTLAMGITFTGCMDDDDDNSELVIATMEPAQEAQSTQAAQQESHEVTLELQENPSTGYGWTYTMDNEGILKEVSNEFIEGEASEGEAGVPGTRKYVFEALADGTVTISLEYKQAWEGGSSEQFRYETYEVKDGIPQHTRSRTSTKALGKDLSNTSN